MVRLFLFILYLYALVVHLVFNKYEVGGRKLSKNEELDIKKQLKLLNKPAIKTIKMRPSCDHKRVSAKALLSEREMSEFKLKDGGCPKGTVPIRRVAKDDLIQIKLYAAQYASKANPNGPQTSGIHHSSAEVILQNGMDTLKAGWMDKKNGNWWLEAGQDHVQIRFWPKQIFTKLAQPANYIACGGEVFSPNQSLPPMGSGHRPRIDAQYDAYCSNFDMINEAYEFVDPKHVEEFSDREAYGVKDLEQTKLGHVVLYGGPNKP
ncbi:hypothetical protein Ancab_020021 [Ancistrocladus abbreviatus]